MSILNARWFEESFARSGEWYLENEKLLYSVCEDENFNETQFFDEEGKIYMFVSSSGEVIYIGKTSNTVRQRFVGYRTPGNTQQTNRRVNDSLVELIKNGEKVYIYISDFPNQLKWENFSISLSSGLEDALIDSIQPRLNRLGINSVAKPELALLQVDGGEGEEIEGGLGILDDDSALSAGEFIVFLQADYTYKKGFMNLRKKTSEQIGMHDEELRLDLYRGDTLEETVISKINRTANRNGSVRVIGNNTQLARWFQTLPRGTRLLGTVLGMQHVRLQYLTSENEPESSFNILLSAQHTYGNGYLNLRKKTSGQLADGGKLEIELYRGDELEKTVVSGINRTANRNGSVRVVGNNAQLARWFQTFERETLLKGTVISRNKIKLVYRS